MPDPAPASPPADALPFWIIQRARPDQGLLRAGGSAFRHPTRESATREAQRLTTRHPGVAFLLIQIADVYCAPPGADDGDDDEKGE